MEKLKWCVLVVLVACGSPARAFVWHVADGQHDGTDCDATEKSSLINTVLPHMELIFPQADKYAQAMTGAAKDSFAFTYWLQRSSFEGADP